MGPTKPSPERSSRCRSIPPGPDEGFNVVVHRKTLHGHGEPLRVTFALDCCDREAISWAATTGGHSGDVVRDVMLAAVENRFDNVRKSNG
jgi:transposase InsO family protein